MTFKALYDLYIDDISHRLRENSIDGKKNVFKNHILPYFKDKPVNVITGLDKVERAVVALNLVPSELNGAQLEAGKTYDVEFIYLLVRF